MLPWLLCALLGVLVLALLGKVRTLTRSMEEICDQMEDRLEGDTNNLLTLSTRDPHARRLAARLNAQLRLLRQQRRQYLNGDRELKEAVTNISHDLRTPLTAICGYLDLLDRQAHATSPAISARFFYMNYASAPLLPWRLTTTSPPSCPWSPWP